MNPRFLPLVGEFADVLTSLLEPGIGPNRTRAAALFRQGAELFGKLGAHRGQAAGEAVEEFQMLREVVLRELLGGLTGLRFRGWDLRNLLFLNRLIDIGVTYASVGHTDTLFFNLVHGTGVVEEPSDEVLDEVREQVAALRREMEALMEVERAAVEES